MIEHHHSRCTPVILALATSLLFVLSQAAARPPNHHLRRGAPLNTERHVVPGRYIVTLKERTGPSTGRGAHAAQEGRAKQLLSPFRGLNLEKVTVYSEALSGFSFQVPDGADENAILAQLRRNSQVVSIAPVRIARLQPLGVMPVSGPLTPPTIHGTGARTGLDNARKAGWTGAGVKVGIIDSGIDYTHPALGGCFGPLSPGKQCRVIAGKDFIGAEYDATGTAILDEDPMDCSGHGTHVAGIVGANSTSGPIGPWTGVAPGVLFGAYRVLSCQGYSDYDIVLQGLDQAVKDGMHVINFSLRFLELAAFSDSPLAASFARVTAKGIIVTIASGNEGVDGVFALSQPTAAIGPLTVGYVNNWQGYGVTFTLDVAPTRIIATQYIIPGANNAVLNVSRLVGARFIALDPHDCDVSSIPNVTGAVVLSEYSAMCYNAQEEELRYRRPLLSLFYYDTANNPAIASDGYFRSPFGYISYLDGTYLSGKLVGNSASRVLSARPQGPGNYYALPNGGGMSPDSSYGPEARLQFKPDLVAPGGPVVSTWLSSSGSFAVETGSSMASPFMAGCAALWRQARLVQGGPNFTAADVSPVALLRDLSTTAVAVPIQVATPTELDSPAHAGAGLVQIDRAIANRVVVSPMRFVLTSPIRGNRTLTFKVTNRNSARVVLRLGHRSSQALKLVRTIEGPVYDRLYLAVSFRDVLNRTITNITVPPNAIATVKVVFILPPSLLGMRRLLGGYITLTPVAAGVPLPAGATPLSLPYFTLSSWLSNVPALDESVPESIAQCNVSVDDFFGGFGDCFFTVPKAGALGFCPEVATLSSVTVVAYLQMPVMRVRLLLFNATTTPNKIPTYVLLGVVVDRRFVQRYFASSDLYYNVLDDALFKSPQGWQGQYRDMGGVTKRLVAGRTYALQLELTRTSSFDLPANASTIDRAMLCRFRAP